MRKYLAAVAALVFLLPLPVSAEEIPCPDPARPIHYLPYCFSQDELTAYLATQYETVAPTPVYVDLVERWRPLVANYWPAELVPWAMAIIKCESGGNPWADNPTSTAAGLFQFLKSTWDQGPAPALGLPNYWTGAPYVAEWNIQAAAWLYQNWGGKSQWQCKSNL